MNIEHEKQILPELEAPVMETVGHISVKIGDSGCMLLRDGLQSIGLGAFKKTFAEVGCV